MKISLNRKEQFEEEELNPVDMSSHRGSRSLWLRHLHSDKGAGVDEIWLLNLKAPDKVEVVWVVFKCTSSVLHGDLGSVFGLAKWYCGPCF